MASIYDTWMRKLNEEDDDLAGPQEQAALLSYLNGTATAYEAACEFKKQATGPENRSTGLVWSLLVDVAKEFRQAHQNLLELLDVMAPLQATEMADFAFELREACDGIESASQSSLSTTTEEQHFINLCAFIARFWHHQRGEWAYWATHLLHDGLEDDHGKALTNLYGQAVAQLFLFSGSDLYASCHTTQSSELSIGPLLLKERETAAVSRWDFWRQRLGQLKKSELLSVETEELFSKALESMAKVEAETGYAVPLEA